MCSLALKSLFIVFSFASLSLASGGGAPAAEEGKEKAPATKEIKSSEESFGVVQARVQALEAKVHSGEEEIKKLIEEKQHIKDPEKANEIIKEMISIHHQLEKNVKEYDQQRALLNYRYPEKGQVEKRNYERIEVRSIEEMEGQMSLSKTVKKTLNKARLQYKSSAPSKNNENEEHGKNRKHSTKELRPSLVDPVILKK